MTLKILKAQGFKVICFLYFAGVAADEISRRVGGARCEERLEPTFRAHQVSEQGIVCGLRPRGSAFQRALDEALQHMHEFLEL